MPWQPRLEEKPVPLPYMLKSPGTSAGAIAEIADDDGLRLGSPWMLLGLGPLGLLLIARLLMAWWNRSDHFY